MFDEIIDIVIKLLAGIIVLYVIPSIKQFFLAKIGEINANKLNEKIEDFVKAADQLYKGKDPTGEIRNKYVKEQLVALGYAITDVINAQIESKVSDLGHNVCNN